ncbi:MAG: multiubiquitin domain-containing protein [Jatrophihabitantaceae bacterium]
MTHTMSDTGVTAHLQRLTGNPQRPYAVYVYDVDGVTYEHDHRMITGAQIMSAAGLDPQQGLIHILRDGSRVTVTAAATVDLASGAHFKRRPRFKRG